MSPVYYKLAIDGWPESERIVIRNGTSSPTVIASFPLDFVRRGGDNTWQYVLDMVENVVDPEPGHPGVIRDSTGLPVNPEASPISGDFWFEHSGGLNILAFTRGPEYFTRFRPPNPEGSHSTRSDSKRSSVNQNKFRVSLIARDYGCLVTEVVYDYCTASHIVPFSRPDVYASLLNSIGAPPLFAPSVGLLLRDDLHHAYDRLEWSLYLKNGTYYIHFFDLRTPGSDSHGKALTPDRFRGPQSDRPDPRLVKWHYSQCAKAHFRGFSAGMDMGPPNTMLD